MQFMHGEGKTNVYYYPLSRVSLRNTCSDSILQDLPKHWAHSMAIVLRRVGRVVRGTDNGCGENFSCASLNSDQGPFGPSSTHAPSTSTISTCNGHCLKVSLLLCPTQSIRSAETSIHPLTSMTDPIPNDGAPPTRRGPISLPT